MPMSWKNTAKVKFVFDVIIIIITIVVVVLWPSWATGCPVSVLAFTSSRGLLTRRRGRHRLPVGLCFRICFGIPWSSVQWTFWSHLFLYAWSFVPSSPFWGFKKLLPFLHCRKECILLLVAKMSSPKLIACFCLVATSRFQYHKEMLVRLG
jgi:hypothetical protein